MRLCFAAAALAALTACGGPNSGATLPAHVSNPVSSSRRALPDDTDRNVSRIVGSSDGRVIAAQVTKNGAPYVVVARHANDKPLPLQRMPGYLLDGGAPLVGTRDGSAVHIKSLTRGVSFSVPLSTEPHGAIPPATAYDGTRWTTGAEWDVAPAPASPGLLRVESRAGSVVVAWYLPGSAAPAWQHVVPQSVTGGQSTGRVTADGAIVVVAVEGPVGSSTLIAYAASDGRVQWKQSVAARTTGWLRIAPSGDRMALMVRHPNHMACASCMRAEVRRVSDGGIVSSFDVKPRAFTNFADVWFTGKQLWFYHHQSEVRGHAGRPLLCGYELYDATRGVLLRSGDQAVGAWGRAYGGCHVQALLPFGDGGAVAVKVPTTVLDTLVFAAPP